MIIIAIKLITLRMMIDQFANNKNNQEAKKRKEITQGMKEGIKGNRFVCPSTNKETTSRQT